MALESNKNMKELNPAANMGNPGQQTDTTQANTASSQLQPETQIDVNPEKPQTTVSTTSESASENYAGFVRRYAAYSVDGIILGIINWILSMIFIVPMLALGATEESGVAGGVLSIVLWLVQMGILVAYYVYFISAKGQTPGKMLFKIKIQKEETGTNPSYVSAFLREIVGKIISGIILGLGFIWIIFDKKKQGWHDKIAGTIAFEEGELSTGRKLLMYLFFILPILAIIGVIAVVVLVGINPAAQLERAREDQMRFEQQQMEFEDMQQEFMQETEDSMMMQDTDFNEN